MASGSVRGHALGMDNARSNRDHPRALQRSSLELQREAVNLVKHASGAASPAQSIRLREPQMYDAPSANTAPGNAQTASAMPGGFSVGSPGTGSA